MAGDIRDGITFFKYSAVQNFIYYSFVIHEVMKMGAFQFGPILFFRKAENLKLYVEILTNKRFSIVLFLIHGWLLWQTERATFSLYLLRIPVK